MPSDYPERALYIVEGEVELAQGRFDPIPVETEIMRLHEGNIARYRLRLAEYRAWRESWR